MDRNLQIWSEESRLLRKLSVVCAILSLLSAGLVFFTWSSGLVAFDSFAALSIPFIVAFLLLINSAIIGHFEENSSKEEEERVAIEKRREKMALDADVDALFLSQRALRLYKKYSPYAIALAEFIALLGLSYLFWKHWGARLKPLEPRNALQCAFASALLSIVSLFAGIFLVGQSKSRSFRTLRPAGSWLVAVFGMGMLVSLSILLSKFAYTAWDGRTAKFLLIVYVILAAELLLNFIVEFYRPKRAGDDSLFFESRLLSIASDPGGLAKGLFDTLEYQFGFRVGRRELFNFAESALVPILLVWLGALWLFTSIVEVKTDEVGVREFFGKRQDSPLLQPGIHFKAPWPVEKISRFPVRKIQEIVIGPEFKEEKGRKELPEVILWTKQHYAKEPRFLVASAKEVSGDDAPVSFLAAAFPIQFKIKEGGLIDYAYMHRDSPEILKDLAEQEIGKYLASVDIIKAMSLDRSMMIGDLHRILQGACDRLKLGVEIVSLNFLDSHPPTEQVAPSFQEVVGALEEKETKILSAKKYESKLANEIESEVARIILDSKTGATNAEKLAEAENARFLKQLDAYRRMPQMFRLRHYLDFFENDCKMIRKLVIASSIPHNVFILNFEEKARLDLMEADLVDISGGSSGTKK